MADISSAYILSALLQDNEAFSNHPFICFVFFLLVAVLMIAPSVYFLLLAVQ